MPIVARYQAALTVENPDATYDFVSMEGYLVGRLVIKTVRAAGQDLTRACLLAAMQGVGDVDLAATIETPFEDGYEHLRQDFNGALESLPDPMSSIASSTDRIGHGSKAIAKSSDDLSRRTDRSVATLKKPPTPWPC